MSQLLDLLNEAEAKADCVSRLSTNENTKELLDYALTLIREAYIGESGQNAKTPMEVIADICFAKSLTQAAISLTKNDAKDS